MILRPLISATILTAALAVFSCAGRAEEPRTAETRFLCRDARSAAQYLHTAKSGDGMATLTTMHSLVQEGFCAISPIWVKVELIKPMTAPTRVDEKTVQVWEAIGEGGHTVYILMLVSGPKV